MNRESGAARPTAMEPDERLPRVTSMSRAETSRGDEVADLYAYACPRLIGLLICIGASHGDAEEIAQDAYVKLLTRWERVRSFDDPEAWVRAVAVRMLFSRMRRARVARLGLPRLVGRAAHQPPPSPDTVDVAAALRTLSPAHRAVVVLHHALDLPIEQVAAELQVPVGTVKSRLARARAALVSILDDEEIVPHA
jgi:RNA polymerase sigma-70 factor, ECF subfamily